MATNALADTLPLLHLRRQAAAHGWHLAAVDGQRPDRCFTYKRQDEDGRHTARFWPGNWRWDRFEDYRTSRVLLQTSDGELHIAHIGLSQAARIVRAYFGWPDPAADPAAWPPKSTALVPVAVYALYTAEGDCPNPNVATKEGVS